MCVDDETSIVQESDGTYTVGPDGFFELWEPLKGIPTRELAEQIVAALWSAENAGSRHYAEGED